jgi:hypothetical protein
VNASVLPVVTLTRLSGGALGTFGTLVTPSGRSYRTVERPRGRNAVGIACIPAGTYRCQLGPSETNQPHLDKAYHVLGVPGRTLVRLHVANHPTDVQGCIGPGLSFDHDDHPTCVWSSWAAVLSLGEELGWEDFWLRIIDPDDALNQPEVPA